MNQPKTTTKYLQATLELVQFDEGRYSWIHYNASQPHYHYLNDTMPHAIDIQLRSENGFVLTFSEVGDNLVLVFETVVEDEYSADIQSNEMRRIQLKMTQEKEEKSWTLVPTGIQVSYVI